MSGDTPLHLAARYGYGDIVSMLVEAGSSLSVRNCKGETPLSLAHNKQIAHTLQVCYIPVYFSENVSLRNKL